MQFAIFLILDTKCPLFGKKHLLFLLDQALQFWDIVSKTTANEGFNGSQKRSIKVKKCVDSDLFFCEIGRTHRVVQKQQQHQKMRTKTLLVAAAAALAASITASQAQTVYSQNVVGYVNTVLNPGFTMVCNPLNGTTNAAESLLPALQGGENIFVWHGTGYYIYSFTSPGAGTGNGWQSDWVDGGATPPAAPTIPGDQTDTADGVYWAPQPILTPGEGFFLQNPNSAETNTFTGTVVTANTNTLNPGFTMLASAIPVAGDAETNSAITLTSNFQGGENVFVWHGTGYYIYSWTGPGTGTGNGWQSDWVDGGATPPAAPTIPGDQTDSGDGVYWAPPLQLTVGQGVFIQNPNASEQWSQTITNIP